MVVVDLAMMSVAQRIRKLTRWASIELGALTAYVVLISLSKYFSFEYLCIRYDFCTAHLGSQEILSDHVQF